MREFLSCIRELDVRVRHSALNSLKSEAFWLKPNFMSLLNLIDMMISLGPLILWWDGGGKGEKFIQELRPLIHRGIREDYNDFFRTLALKAYKWRQMKYIEKRLGLEGSPEIQDDDSQVNFGELVNSIPYDEEDDESEEEDQDEGISEIYLQFQNKTR